MTSTRRLVARERRLEGERKREADRLRIAHDLADGHAEELAALLKMSYVDLVLWKNTRG